MDKYEKLRELAAKATPGPWVAKESNRFAARIERGGTNGECVVYIPESCPNCNQGCLDLADAKYIVAACNAVPDLLDEGVELRVSLEAEIANNKRLLDENKRSEITLRHLNEAVTGLQSENQRLRSLASYLAALPEVPKPYKADGKRNALVDFEVVVDEMNRTIRRAREALEQK